MDALSTIPKNKREEIRVGLDQFNGHDLFAARVWFLTEDGNRLPGKSGIAFKASLLPEFARAVEMALAEAKKRGLVR
jgi:hypothetical protein